MRRSLAVQVALVAVATTAFSSAALAHVGDHSHMGFIEGVLHPFSGLDHMLAMVAVGGLAAWYRGKGRVQAQRQPVILPAVARTDTG